MLQTGHLTLPSNYDPLLSLWETQVAIKKLKDFFEQTLAKELRLVRVTAPLFVIPESGLNDNLNGIERPVAFDVPAMSGTHCEIVHSLAKWKRMALKRYGFREGHGLYTDMNAIRRDEELDNLHSLYVDQWDWEKIIAASDRTESYLREIVTAIYNCLLRTAAYIQDEYPSLKHCLPEEITFVTAQELEDMYPNMSPAQREHVITAEKKAVFLMKIGSKLSSGQRHDSRAPDYDDWSLNGDIIVWHPILQTAVELSSMGIRVDREALLAQTEEVGCRDLLNLDFHRKLLTGQLPYTIGGGIGQSRLCMYFLKRAHVGEVQASVWPASMIEECGQNNIVLL